MHAAVATASLAVCLSAAVAIAQSVGSATGPLVYLRDVEPSIRQDMRYAGAQNFMGRPVPGYGAAECLLLPEVALAIAAAQREALRQGLSLKVYDCYRPRRAVAAFWAWAQNEAGDAFSAHYHPRLDRARLHSLGYIARSSTHAHGISVDVTLVPLSPAAAGDRAAAASDPPCHLGRREVGPDAGLDMGTSFDCLDPRSGAGATGLTAAQREARQTLQLLMRRHGFSGYAREWWHFTHDAAAGSTRALDLPIAPRR